MVTVPPQKELPPTRREITEGWVRSAIAGAPNGSLRRIVLYLVVAVALGLNIGLSGLLLFSAIVSVVGLIALLLLAVTDKLA